MLLLGWPADRRDAGCACAGRGEPPDRQPATPHRPRSPTPRRRASGCCRMRPARSPLARPAVTATTCFVAALDGSPTSPLIVGGDDIAPAWSPDGQTGRDHPRHRPEPGDLRRRPEQPHRHPDQPAGQPGALPGLVARRSAAGVRAAQRWHLAPGAGRSRQRPGRPAGARAGGLDLLGARAAALRRASRARAAARHLRA